MDNSKLFYVINEEGIRQEATILAKYKLLNGFNYITYTYGEINENDMIKIYSTGVVGSKGNYSCKEIDTTTEWDEIKNILKLLAKDEKEKLPEYNESNLSFIGEEIFVKKPKKLLVSTKFSQTISKKYSEISAPIIDDVRIEEKITPISDLNMTSFNLPPIIPEPVVQPQEISVSEPEVETPIITVPTFEELQARTKKVTEVIENKDEVEEEKPIEKPEPISFSKKTDYEAKFKSEVEPLLLDMYSRQQAQIDALEEELSKTKFDLFEKQKEALSLKKDNEELAVKGTKLESELSEAKAKVDGIMNVLNGNK